MDSGKLWLTIIGAALGTFALRMSFLGPWARVQFPPMLRRALAYAPPVIFAALITPMILQLGKPPLPAAQMFARIGAVVVTLLWALWRGGQVMPLIVGMATLHGLNALLIA